VDPAVSAVGTFFLCRLEEWLQFVCGTVEDHPGWDAFPRLKYSLLFPCKGVVDELTCAEIEEMLISFQDQAKLGG
jgi:hypothetical protein